MEKIFEQTLLYDFYGELLTEHQKSIYEDAVCNDMSLGEIAEELGISRQGVHDLIKRCDRTLQIYESKLHLVERFAKAKEKIAEIEKLTEAVPQGAEVKAGCRAEGDATQGKSDLEEGIRDMNRRMKRIREFTGELMKEI